MSDEQFCPFDEAWMGRCGKELDKGIDFCPKHLGQKCWCGEQAVKNCSMASSLVCGAPTCGEHECAHVSHGMTGSEGMKHNEKGHAQWETWKAEHGTP